MGDYPRFEAANGCRIERINKPLKAYMADQYHSPDKVDLPSTIPGEDVVKVTVVEPNRWKIVTSAGFILYLSEFGHSLPPTSPTQWECDLWFGGYTGKPEFALPTLRLSEDKATDITTPHERGEEPRIARVYQPLNSVQKATEKRTRRALMEWIREHRSEFLTQFADPSISDQHRMIIEDLLIPGVPVTPSSIRSNVDEAILATMARVGLFSTWDCRYAITNHDLRDAGIWLTIKKQLKHQHGPLHDQAYRER